MTWEHQCDAPCASACRWGCGGESQGVVRRARAPGFQAKSDQLSSQNQRRASSIGPRNCLPARHSQLQVPPRRDRKATAASSDRIHRDPRRHAPISKKKNPAAINIIIIIASSHYPPETGCRGTSFPRLRSGVTTFWYRDALRGRVCSSGPQHDILRLVWVD